MRNKCLQLLAGEHKTILRAADVLDAVAGHAETARELIKEDIRGLLEIFRLFIDELHQGKEEGALFPVFTAVCDRAEIEPVRHMLFEHESDRSLVGALEDATMTSNPREFSVYAARLSELLRIHVSKEDNILFEMMDRVLSAEHDARILHEFEAFDRDFSDRGQQRLLHRLRMLEWKYLRKIA